MFLRLHSLLRLFPALWPMDKGLILHAGLYIDLKMDELVPLVWFVPLVLDQYGHTGFKRSHKKLRNQEKLINNRIMTNKCEFNT